MSWWESKLEEAGPEMVATAKAIEESAAERYRRAMCLVYARLATGRPLSSLFGYDTAFSLSWIFDAAGNNRAPINVIQAVQEAIAAKIAKNKPRALILTQGGDYQLQRQAKQLTKYLDGLNDATGVYKLSRSVFQDAAYFGAGLFRPYPDTTKNMINTCRVLPVQVLVDDVESAFGSPQSVYEKRYVYRGQLAKMFPEKAEMIRQAKTANPNGVDQRVSEMVAVYEGWHLGARRLVAIEEGALGEGEWKYDWIPHVKFDWRVPVTGFWGSGVTENLAGMQREINLTLMRIADAAKSAKQWIFVKPGAKLTKAHMTNEPGTIVEAEDAPTFTTGIAVPPELFGYVDRLYQRCLDMEGVSGLSMSGQKPAGISAAVAMREYHDIESERFVQLGQGWEESFVELADKQIAMSRDLYSGRKTVAIKAPGTKFLETIKWDDVDMPENLYSVRTFPTSIFPTSPAARLQRVTELFESGFIPDRETALSLLDFPDLEGSLSLQLASIEEVKRILGQIVESGKYEPPEPYINLDQARRMCQGMILKCRGDGVAAVRIEKLMRWLDDVIDLQSQTQKKEGPVPGQMPTGQVAPPMPPVVPPPLIPGLPPPGTLDVIGQQINPSIPSEIPG